nr:hypothetical protein CTI12_AA404440 [Tanacetum cinerariifolium]
MFWSIGFWDRLGKMIKELYKSTLWNCFELEEWGQVEWAIMSKNFERQEKSPYTYHALLYADAEDENGGLNLTLQGVWISLFFEPMGFWNNL